MSKPEGLFLVTNTGQRIPIDLRLHKTENLIRYWEPVIEGDLNNIMPNVVAFDGPRIDGGEAVTFPEPGPGWNTREWGEQLMANSRHVFRFYEQGEQ